jgi:hypothetical protein
MRRCALALAAAAAFLTVPSALSAQTFQIGPGGVRVDDGRGRRAGGQCEELRLACENKDRLGERGEGQLPSLPRNLSATRSPGRVPGVAGRVPQQGSARRTGRG